MIHYKDLKHNTTYIIYVNLKKIIGYFQYIDTYRGDIKKAIFLNQDNCLIFVPFLELVNVLETSSLEAELL
jgi:glycopeptide antibiotics resistance protein